MILTFLLSGSYLTVKMAHGLGWSPLVLPPLSGETCWVCDPVAAGEGSGEGRRTWGDGVAGSGSRGSQERFPGQSVSWMKGKERGGRVAVREGARQRGRTPGVQKVRVCGQLRKKSPFAWEARCIEGPRGWSRPCIGRACSEGPKRLGHMGPPTTCHSI